MNILTKLYFFEAQYNLIVLKFLLNPN